MCAIVHQYFNCSHMNEYLSFPVSCAAVTELSAVAQGESWDQPLPVPLLCARPPQHNVPRCPPPAGPQRQQGAHLQDRSVNLCSLCGYIYIFVWIYIFAIYICDIFIYIYIYVDTCCNQSLLLQTDAMWVKTESSGFCLQDSGTQKTGWPSRCSVSAWWHQRSSPWKRRHRRRVWRPFLTCRDGA